MHIDLAIVLAGAIVGFAVGRDSKRASASAPGQTVPVAIDPHVAAGLALLERRRAQLVQRLAEAEGTKVELDVYARSVVQHTADGVAQDISWLDRLIAGERATPHSVPTELTYEGDIR